MNGFYLKKASEPGKSEIDVDRKVIEYNKIFKLYNHAIFQSGGNAYFLK